MSANAKGDTQTGQQPVPEKQQESRLKPPPRRSNPVGTGNLLDEHIAEIESPLNDDAKRQAAAAERIARQFVDKRFDSPARPVKRSISLSLPDTLVSKCEDITTDNRRKNKPNCPRNVSALVTIALEQYFNAQQPAEHKD